MVSVTTATNARQRLYPIPDECFVRFEHKANVVDTFNRLQDPHHNHYIDHEVYIAQMSAVKQLHLLLGLEHVGFGKLHMMQSWYKTNKPGTYTRRNYPPCIGCDVAGIHAKSTRKVDKDYGELQANDHLSADLCIRKKGGTPAALGGYRAYLLITSGGPR